MQAFFSKRKELFFLITALILPLIFTFFWTLKNSQLPTSDATDYLLTAFKIYEHFVDEGVRSGIAHLFYVRGWRPIFFGDLIVPFLLISKGNIAFAYKATALMCVAMSGIYVYLLFRLQLDRISSAIATNLIVLLPFVQRPVLVFFAESALFFCVFASIYHLIRSDFFLHKRHTYAFAFFFALALLVRPVEAAAHLIFIVSLFLFLGWRKNYFSTKQVLTIFAIAAMSLFLFFLVQATHFLNHSPLKPIDGGAYDIKYAKTLYRALIATILGVLFAWTLMIVHYLRSNQVVEKGQYQRPVVIIFTFVFAVAVAWFVPYAFSTFLWVFRTSIGDVAENATLIIERDFLTGLHYFVGEESIFVVCATLALAILSFLLFNRKQKKEILSSNLFIYLLLLIPFGVWEVCFTVQSTSRKLSIAFPALVMVFLLFSLRAGKVWRIRTIGISAIVILQFLFGFFSVEKKIATPYDHLFGDYPEAITVQPNPHNVVTQFLDEAYKNYHFKDVIFHVIPSGFSPVDPFLMIMLSRIENKPYISGYAYYSSYNKNHLKDYSNEPLFVGDKAENMVVSAANAEMFNQKYLKETDPSVKAMYEILSYYAQNKLDLINRKLGPCLDVKTGRLENFRGCLLFPTKKNMSS